MLLGVQALLGAPARGGEGPRRRPAALGHGRRTPSAAFRQGVISNLGNPKMAAFFISLLPQFAHGGHAGFLALLPLGLVFCLMTLVWLTAYAMAVAKAGDALRRPAIRRILDAVTGTVLVALGLRLAIERR